MNLLQSVCANQEHLGAIKEIVSLVHRKWHTLTDNVVVFLIILKVDQEFVRDV